MTFTSTSILLHATAVAQTTTMKPDSDPLRYPWGETMPGSGQSLELAPGIRWLRLDLPFALDHINVWLLRDRHNDREGWTLVDCGVDQPATRAQWECLVASTLGGLPLVRIIATHMHPDHLGLAHWLCERWQAPLWISATDYATARVATMDASGFAGERAAQFYRSMGLADESQLAAIRSRGNLYSRLVPALPTSYRRLHHGQRLTIGGRQWRCVAGYGHAPEHMALFCEDEPVLISGDMVLPRISTNVSVYASEPEADALGLFLSSLVEYRSLPAETLVLPAHGRPFGGRGSQGAQGLHGRIAQLERHHRDRLADLLAACATQALSAAEALPILFQRPIGPEQMTFALGESLAHLHRLWHAGQLHRQADRQGVWRFRATATAPVSSSAEPLPA